MERKEFWYIANPYSDPDPAVRAARVASVSRLVQHLLKTHPNVFPLAPVPYTAPYEDLLTPDEWRERDLIALDKADRLVVECSSGWKKSIGVQKEIQYALDHDIPITYTDPIPLKSVI